MTKQKDFKSDTLSQDKDLSKKQGGTYQKSFSRSISRSISNRQKLLLENNNTQNIENFLKKDFKKFYLEIGFGSGENLINLSYKIPDCGFIGVEPFINGAIKVITHIEENKIKNIFVYTDDIQNIIHSIPNNLFYKILVLFPDPWPKTKQNKRRLLQYEFIKLLLSKSCGSILFATDDNNYFHNVSSICINNGINFKIINRPTWLIPSRYEQKAIAKNNKCNFMEIFN